jgi:hypothetical protein
MRWLVDEAKHNESSAADLACALKELTSDPAVSKPLKKLARKGLFLLGAPQGETDAPEHAVVEALPEWRAWMSCTDGSGGQLLLLARIDTSMTYRMLIVYSQEAVGITDAFEDRMTASELPDRVAALGQKISAFGEVAPDFIKSRIAAAAHDTREAGNRVPNAVAFWAAALATEPADHPAKQLELPPVAPDKELAEVLFQQPTLGWIFEIPKIAPMVKQLAEAADSKIEVAEDVKQSRLTGIVRDATAEIFDERNVRWFERRFYDLAYLRFLAGKPEEAALARAAAEDVAKEGANSKVAIALSQKTLAYFLEMARRGR